MEFIKIVLFLFVVNKNLLKKKNKTWYFSVADLSTCSGKLHFETSYQNASMVHLKGYIAKEIYRWNVLSCPCNTKGLSKKKKILSGLDLTTRDSYFTIPVEVFKPKFSRKHISRIIWSEQNTRLWPSKLKINTELCGKDIILKTLLSTISSMIHFFIKQKFCKYQFLYSQK